MFPTPNATPITPTAALSSATGILHLMNLDTAMVVIIAVVIAISAFWWLVGRNGNDD